MIFLAIVDKSDKISIFKALGIALNSMFIVFGILLLIWLFVVVVKYIKLPGSKEKVNPLLSENKSTEITDDDMMAAVLVATVDFYEETGKEVKLVSVRKL